MKRSSTKKKSTKITATSKKRSRGKGNTKAGLPPESVSERVKKQEILALVYKLNREATKVVFVGGHLDCMYGWEFLATGTDVITYAVKVDSNKGDDRLGNISSAYAANYQKTASGSYLWERFEMYEDVLAILSAGVRPTKLSLSKANSEGEWVFNG